MPRKIESEVKTPAVIEGEALSAQRGANLLFFSFRFSQGYPYLHGEIFQYLHITHPGWRIANTLKKEVFTTVMGRIHNFVSHSQPEEDAHQSQTRILHPHTNTNNITRAIELGKQLHKMQNVLNSDHFRQKEDLVPSLTIDMIERDYLFLAQNKGRPRSDPDASKPSQDPWLSQVCYYGLEGNTTGIPEYDQMFSDIKTHIQTRGLPKQRDLPDDMSVTDKFARVVSIYKAYHQEGLGTRQFQEPVAKAS